MCRNLNTGPDLGVAPVLHPPQRLHPSQPLSWASPFPDRQHPVPRRLSHWARPIGQRIGSHPGYRDGHTTNRRSGSTPMMGCYCLTILPVQAGRRLHWLQRHKDPNDRRMPCFAPVRWRPSIGRTLALSAPRRPRCSPQLLPFGLLRHRLSSNSLWHWWTSGWSCA